MEDLKEMRDAMNEGCKAMWSAKKCEEQWKIVDKCEEVSVKKQTPYNV